ncbi:MAG: efflux RND transporter permease subunit [Bacteroidales bacterium]|jgi:multidrug efflux pump subunit AcrB|nr:efflux RND transporter permease subunit [Bacteroidales bacterium]
MSSPSEQTPRFSPFSLNIFFVVLIITGAAIMPLLSLQLNPTRFLPSLTVSYTWPDAAARVVEQQVTSVLEGVISTLPGVSRLSSTTNNESGEITVEFDRNTDLRTKRFEVASLIRDAHSRLPDRVSYPVIQMNMPSNTSGSVILSYQVTGNEAPSYIFSIAEELLKPAIASVDGVYSVDIYGATPRAWELIYDQQVLSSMGVTPGQVRDAIRAYLSVREAGGGVDNPLSSGMQRTYLTMVGHRPDTVRWEDIPVIAGSGRVLMLSDLVTVKLRDERPRSYYRINGLNTIAMVISAGRNVNNIRVAEEVKDVVKRMKSKIPPGHDVILSLDNTGFIREEISRNLFRAALSVILLLVFALLVSRDLKYMLILFISMVATIFIAFIFYWLFRLEIHLYSMAGIAVSFGMIISNIIVMTDHIKYHHNRKVGISLLAATLTTVGALVVIFFLDEASRVTLADFAAVVIINLMVSLLVALFFIPSLAQSIGFGGKSDAANFQGNRFGGKSAAANIRRKRFAVRLTRFYERAIKSFIRYRKAYIIAAVLLFGLPLFWLPDSLPVEKIRTTATLEPELTRWQQLYNKTLGSRKYVADIKPVVNKLTGGTLRLFSDRVKSSNYYYFRGSDDVERTQLSVSIGLSEEGLTLEDMNEVCLGLENMIAAYSEVDRFTTRVSSLSSASLTVTFKPEHDRTIFPFILKMRIEDYMMGIGSYHVQVYGVGKAFSNQVYSDYLRGSYSIVLKGYNFDILSGYAEDLKERLISSAKGRIKDVYILGGEDRWSVKKQYRNIVTADRESVTLAGSDMYNLYEHTLSLSRKIQDGGQVYMGGFLAPMTLRSAYAETYEMWDIYNEPMITGSHGMVKLKDLLSMTREITDNSISREDQQYIITVTYDFIGNYELARIIRDRNIEETAALLPLGYSVRSSSYTYSWFTQKNNYPLLLLVIAIIYLVCAILLESLRQPFIVLGLIPFSFIGVFITFSLFKIQADEGVFAAMILLCGLAVNSALYILDDYNRLKRSGRPLPAVRLYLKAFNGKIIPVILTILSTIVGLLPFLLTGRDERFWFALAAGAIGGLLFSMLGVLVFQPMMLRRDHTVFPVAGRFSDHADRSGPAGLQSNSGNAEPQNPDKTDNSVHHG